MTILLRNNTKQVLDELKRIGYKLCPCCYSRGCVWLFCETDEQMDDVPQGDSVPTNELPY